MIPSPDAVLAERFRVTGGPLGQGGTAVVVPAIEEESGREVAIKLLHDHLSGDAGALETLRAEAGRASRCSHPHILPVVGLWSDEGRVMLVSDRVHGESLEAALVRPLVPEAVLALVTQLCDALVAAHAAGIVHGDVRAGNVLLGPQGAVLYDFGVAAFAGRAAVGRPGETAPEVEDGAPPGTAADLYGLGIILCRALTGRRPFEGATPWATLAHQKESPARPAAGPQGLRDLATALTQPDPTKRPPDARSVRIALARLKKSPNRLRLPAQWWVPVRPSRAWLVHGTDPATGGPAVMRAELGRGQAHQLAVRLREDGWDVAVAKDALGWTDLAFLLLATLVAGTVVPVIGAPFGLVGAWLWRRRSPTPHLREVLPVVRAEVPPRRLMPGAEVAALAGLLMLLVAGGLWWGTWLTVIPVIGLAIVAFVALRRQVRDAAAEAARGRVAALLEDVRREVHARAHSLEDQLAILGEVDAIEYEWRGGRKDGDATLLEGEALLTRASAAAERLPEEASGLALDALRGIGAEVDVTR